MNNENRRNFDAKLAAHAQGFLIPGSKLEQAVDYALRSPGKRLRAEFVLETAQQVGLNETATTLLSYAIEMVHVFSLIHDDLPCMDDDDLRRGIPTTHKIYGEAQALLAGDALLSIALQTFNRILLTQTQIQPLHFARAFEHFTQCIGGYGMIGGQSIELENISSNVNELLRVQDLKTGALFRAAILTPLHLVGIPKESAEFQKFENYANAFGFAFQIADDLEDAEQDLREVQEAHLGSKNVLSYYPADQAKKMALDRLKNSPLAPLYSPTKQLMKKLDPNFPE